MRARIADNYAYICECGHLLTEHGWDPAGQWGVDPFACLADVESQEGLTCGCEIPLGYQGRPISESEFRWYDEHRYIDQGRCVIA